MKPWINHGSGEREEETNQRKIQKAKLSEVRDQLTWGLKERETQRAPPSSSVKWEGRARHPGCTRH